MQLPNTGFEIFSLDSVTCPAKSTPVVQNLKLPSAPSVSSFAFQATVEFVLGVVTHAPELGHWMLSVATPQTQNLLSAML